MLIFKPLVAMIMKNNILAIIKDSFLAQCNLPFIHNLTCGQVLFLKNSSSMNTNVVFFSLEIEKHILNLPVYFSLQCHKSQPS